ncbi:MAG: HAD-IA family hydrolase, partial [Muribaculaceae bacterium]|nr:HAD-IA family hydrolase [Muribaculaceae bacterium]
MQLKSVLFDLDGVLVDSEGVYTDFWSEVDRVYPTGVEGFALKIKGSTLPTILNTYFPEEYHPDILKRLERLEHEMDYRLFPGVERLLGELRRAGITVAIVTSSNRPKMDHLFNSIPLFNSHVDTLVTDEDVTESKPSPQGYLIGASRLSSSPASCVVVEDSLAGLRAGRASGAVVVGLTTTNPREAVEPLADCVLPDASHITINLLN